jgi:hypothetical protein
MRFRTSRRLKSVWVLSPVSFPRSRKKSATPASRSTGRGCSRVPEAKGSFRSSPPPPRRPSCPGKASTSATTVPHRRRPSVPWPAEDLVTRRERLYGSVGADRAFCPGSDGSKIYMNALHVYKKGPSGGLGFGFGYENFSPVYTIGLTGLKTVSVPPETRLASRFRSRIPIRRGR